MSLAIRPDQTDWTDEQRKMLPAVVHGGRLDPATSLQLLHYCQKLGVDIFTRQAYAIARGGRVQIQMGVDGLAAVAQRAAAARGQVIGNRPVRYFAADGSEFPFAPKNLHALQYTLTTTDTKSGAVSEYTSTVLLDEYKQGGKMWASMPAVMLEKVALSKAFRMAFPSDLSGVYSTEEVDLRDEKNDRGTYSNSKSRGPAKPVGQVTNAANDEDPFAAVLETAASVKRSMLAILTEAGIEGDDAVEIAKSIWETHTPVDSAAITEAEAAVLRNAAKEAQVEEA
jgi:phage recombination protein Bet